MDRYFQRILFRFETLFGTQKTKAVFNVADESWGELSAAWEQYLRSVDPHVIKQVLTSLAENPPEWPPALGEFIRLCKQFNRQEHRLAVPPPPHAPTEVGRQIQAEIVSSISKTGFDYLAWAKFPASEKAVELLVRGAREDRRLADILNHHLQTDGRDCKNDGARNAIRRIPAPMRSQLAAA
jgi:hypothetical protein